MMSSKVSLLTLKGIFLMTIAVGIISSSFPWAGVVGALICVAGGEPPVEEKSELLLGERDLLSGVGAVLSIHCFDIRSTRCLATTRAEENAPRATHPSLSCS